jgi:hypothetical protein
MVRLYCSPLQVNKATHETTISIFSSEHSTSFMINIKGLEINPEVIDEASMQLLTKAVARAVQQAQRKLRGEERSLHLKAV